MMKVATTTRMPVADPSASSRTAGARKFGANFRALSPVFIKSIKTRLTRQRWLYRLLLRLRASAFGVCEQVSVEVSRISGRTVAIGIDIISSPEPAGGMKYALAACLRFKNEARYLREWIEFHRLFGFEHFYLYNNNSTDNFQEVLQSYIRDGIVTIHDWPSVPASPGADLHCIETYRHEARWIAFIDADEFLFTPDGSDIKAVLAEFEAFPAVAVNWIYFGSSGHERRPEGSVTENYLLRAAKANRHVKSIVNPRKVIKYENSHHWFYSRAALAVNEAGERVYGSFHEPPSVERLRINHYYSKSAEDFLAKAMMKSWVDREGARFPSRREDALQAAVAANNEIEDTLACRLARSSGAPGNHAP